MNLYLQSAAEASQRSRAILMILVTASVLTFLAVPLQGNH